MEDTVSCGFICLLRLRGGSYFPSENGKTWNQVKLVLFKELERVFVPCWWPPVVFFFSFVSSEKAVVLCHLYNEVLHSKSVAKFLLKIFIKDFMNTCYQGLGKAPKHSDYHLFGSLLEI